MSVKILKSLSILFVLLITSGCAKNIYVDRPIEVKVPVKCEVPTVSCQYNKDTDTEVILELVRCIQELKEASKVCK